MHDIFKFRISGPLRALWVWSLPCSLLLALAWAGLAAGKGALIAPDFSSTWTAAKMAVEGKVAGLFSATGFQSEVRKHFHGDDHVRIFGYPPNMVVLIFPLGLLPYIPALILWSLAGAGCLIAALRANRFCRLDAPALALAVLSPAAVYNLIFGNTGSFAAALFLGGFYLCESAPLAAGVLFGLLTVKPHLGILIPFALLLRRNWKCIASAGGTAAALTAAAWLLWGATPWQEYVEIGLPYHVGKLALVAERSLDALMPGPYVDLAMMPGVPFPRLLYGAAALFALFVSLASVRREGISPRSVLILSLATLIISPYSFCYDMVTIMGALVVYLATLAEITLPVHLAFGLLWVLPGTLFLLKRVPLPLSSIILVAALACLHLASRKQGAAARVSQGSPDEKDSFLNACSLDRVD
jgi:hypothetical protein